MGMGIEMAVGSGPGSRLTLHLDEQDRYEPRNRSTRRAEKEQRDHPVR
jgi:hypothetical protein